MSTFAKPDVVAEERPDGVLLLRSAAPLGDHPAHLALSLRHWASSTPDAVFATEGARRLTYGRAARDADAIGQALLDLGASRERPVMVLSGNSLAHLRITLACYTAGVPVIPVSAAYSLLSKDHGRLRAVAALVRPGIVFAEDADAFGPALAATGAQTLTDLGPPAATIPGASLAAAFDAITPDAVAKVLFTSGSTGAPKGVLNTHRMLTANQAMLRDTWTFLRDEPPVLVDWLPWSHTFGGNHNVHLVLTNGGTFHIDTGRPAPALFERSITALAAHRPTVYLNVPAGYAVLVPRLEADPAFARHLFSRLRLLVCAAAAMPTALWDRIRRLVDRHADHPIPLTSAWGATETAPAATSAHWADAPCGSIGVPLPGVTVKLVPVGGKREIRVAGPNVTPGYFDAPDRTAAAFDEDGFYRTGDAAALADPADPGRGLVFDGRIAEDFKLTTGSWVSTGALRTALVSAAGVLSDAVIAGHDRAEVTALAWLNPVEARVLCGADHDVPLDDAVLRAHLADVLASLGSGLGSASRITRLLLLAEPPDLDAGEITDKGYVNQLAVLERRADAVDRLHAEPPGPDVITAAG
ncbi:feruloyl-CoA synthase [Umezawaea sp. Da 62-37]|uniref:feruloyl-CoA synthase n=1 Tax=Umezawaea sp. Da 62-37 TaxID=3075927 RepID=UPI0028F70C51|nr:feruloyl-CoA synthase [Umezawaea sp. Da 62-37]WNV89590.1 feruloyl-CoA synthase [Umezawaea sp. Da 62-37]